MKLQETCRTCLQKYGHYRNIFEDALNNKLISELIMECVPITIQREDKLPNNICNFCVEELTCILQFREMVMTCNETLSQHLENDKYDEINMELEYEIKNELEIDNTLVYSFVDVGENIIEDCQKQTNIGNETKDEIQTTLPDTALMVDPNKNITEELSDEDTLKDSNECDGDSNIIETTSRKVPDEFKYGKYDKKQLEVILDNPDCKRIVESNLSRKEKSDSKVLCQYCNKLYSFRYYVAVHAHTHMGNLPFKCEFCEYRAAIKPALRQHMRMHLQTKDFACIECGKAFKTQQCLKQHKVIHSEDKPFKCKVCGNTFRHLVSLQKHDLIHNDMRRFVCDECGKSFREKISLLNHKATHTNEKKFECTTCGMKFLLKQGLKRHTRRHSDLKPFACDFCSKRFVNKTVLQNHILVHTGEKPFSCEICGKEFRQRTCIYRHMRVHTGETPYACKICPQRFKYSHHLLSHMQKHENNENGKGYKNEKVKEKMEKKGTRAFLYNNQTITKYKQD